MTTKISQIALVSLLSVTGGAALASSFAQFNSNNPQSGTPFSYTTTLDGSGNFQSANFFATNYGGTITFLPYAATAQKFPGSVPINVPVDCVINLNSTTTAGSNGSTQDFFATTMSIIASQNEVRGGVPITAGENLLSSSFSFYGTFRSGFLSVPTMGASVTWQGTDTPSSAVPPVNGSITALHFTSNLMNANYLDLGNPAPYTTQDGELFASTDPLNPATGMSPGTETDPMGNTYFDNFVTDSTVGTFTANFPPLSSVPEPTLIALLIATCTSGGLIGARRRR